MPAAAAAAEPADQQHDAKAPATAPAKADAVESPTNTTTSKDAKKKQQKTEKREKRDRNRDKDADHTSGDDTTKKQKNGAEKKPLLDPSDDNANKRKLTADEMSAMANRLSHTQREAVILPPIFVSKKISNEQVTQNVDKLYTQSIAHRKQVLEKLEQTHKARDSGEATKGDTLLNLHQTIPSTELDNTFERLYTVYMDNKRRKEMKRDDDEKKAKESQRKLNKTELKNCAARLCDESLEKTKQMNQKLLEKYCPEKEVRHLTKEELQASAARLTRKE